MNSELNVQKLYLAESIKNIYYYKFLILSFFFIQIIFIR